MLRQRSIADDVQQLVQPTLVGHSPQANYAVKLADLSAHMQRVDLLLGRTAQLIDPAALSVLMQRWDDLPSPASPLVAEPNAFLRNYLHKHEILILPTPAPITNPSWDQLANFMGKKHPLIQPVLHRIRQLLGKEDLFIMQLAGQPEMTITATCQFCLNLRKTGFLVDYDYQRPLQRSVRGKLSHASSARNFLSGGWLEQFINLEIQRLLHQQGIPFTYLLNPQVTLPNREHFEMDALYEVNNQLLWIEAKSGRYSGCLQKYHQVKAWLQLDPSQVLLVLAKATPKVAQRIAANNGFTVATLQNLSAVLQQMLTTLAQRKEK